MAHSKSSALSLLLGGIIGLIVLRFVLAAVYRIYFHQMRSYPGPRIAAATGLYYMYKCFRGKEAEWVRQMHEQYGDVVRLGPYRLSYINPRAWKEVYNHKLGDRLENRKDPNFYVSEANGASTLVNSDATEEHGRVRRIFSPAFSDRALQLQEPILRQYAEQLISNINRNITDIGVCLDAVKLYNCTTFDIMGDLTFGEPLGLLQQSDYTPWVRTVFKSVKASVFLRFAREYPALDYLVKLIAGKTLLNKRIEHFNHSALRVDKRLAKEDIGKPDIWKFVLERGKEQLSLAQMHANACVFMLAGTETTATLLSGLSYLLLKHPAKMQKLVAEVRALPHKDLSFKKLKQLPYLNACLEEGLRMYPPIPIGLPRVVTSNGAKIDGRWVCGNTIVSVPHHAAYYSELNFTRPRSFEPERWLLGSVGYEQDRKEILQPFSFGPRNCIGKSLAYHEMRIIIASVLWHFDLELCPESEGWMDQKIYTLYEKSELLIKFRRFRN